MHETLHLIRDVFGNTSQWISNNYMKTLEETQYVELRNIRVKKH